jgi:hypothetical protein
LLKGNRLECVARSLPRLEVDAQSRRSAHARSENPAPALSVIDAHDERVIRVRSPGSGSVEVNTARGRRRVRRKAGSERVGEGYDVVVACSEKQDSD